MAHPHERFKPYRPSIFDEDGRISSTVKGGSPTGGETIEPSAPEPSPFRVDQQEVSCREELSAMTGERNALLEKLAARDSEIGQLRSFEGEEEEVSLTKFPKLAAARLRRLLNNTHALRDLYVELGESLASLNEKVRVNNKTADLEIRVSELKGELMRLRAEKEEQEAEFAAKKEEMASRTDAAEFQTAELLETFNSLKEKGVFASAKNALSLILSGDKDKQADALLQLEEAEESLKKLFTNGDKSDSTTA